MRPDVLSMWTVYERPTDYPEQFTARRSEILRDGGLRPTEEVLVADSLAELRTLLKRRHPELARLGRMPADDPVIVEVWL